MQAFVVPPVPLREDEHGVIRLTGSRVTLESIVALFDRGATAEEIAQSFPTLALGPVYSVLGYVVSCRADVDAYLASQGPPASEVAEQRSAAASLRERLLARTRGNPA